jgi:hypothetical protein
MLDPMRCTLVGKTVTVGKSRSFQFSATPQDPDEGVTQADLDRGEELDEKFGWSHTAEDAKRLRKQAAEVHEDPDEEPEGWRIGGPWAEPTHCVHGEPPCERCVPVVRVVRCAECGEFLGIEDHLRIAAERLCDGPDSGLVFTTYYPASAPNVLSPEGARRLREELGPLVADLNATFERLPEDVKRQYREAEQSVIDARNNPSGDFVPKSLYDHVVGEALEMTEELRPSGTVGEGDEGWTSVPRDSRLTKEAVREKLEEIVCEAIDKSELDVETALRLGTRFDAEFGSGAVTP